MGKTAILFPGQGSQYVGMGKNLSEQFDVVKQTIVEASDILGIDMQKLCWEESIEALTQTRNTQPAILTISVAYFRAFLEVFEVPIHYMAGHSLGEFAALTCSGGISFADALLLVRKRGVWMEETATEEQGSMYAVKNLPVSDIKEALSTTGKVTISCYNTPSEIVLSGVGNEMEIIKENLEEKGATVTKLAVSSPFHSPYMSAACGKLAEELKKIPFHSLEIPVVSNVTARPYEDADQILPNLSMQMTEAVKWEQSMKFLMANDVTTCIEMGPKTVLKRMTKGTPFLQSFSFDQLEDRKQLSSHKQFQVSSKLALIHRCLAHAVATKNKNFSKEEYQIGVIEPYQSIMGKLKEVERDGRKPTLEEMKDSLSMLLTVFRTKQVPVEEQKRRIERILQETENQHYFEDFVLSNIEVENQSGSALFI